MGTRVMTSRRAGRFNAALLAIVIALLPLTACVAVPGVYHHHHHRRYYNSVGAGVHFHGPGCGHVVVRGRWVRVR